MKKAAQILQLSQVNFQTRGLDKKLFLWLYPCSLIPLGQMEFRITEKDAGQVAQYYTDYFPKNYKME